MKFILRQRRDFRRTEAFSLVEVVVALGICTFVLVGIMGLFMAGMRVNRDSEDEIQAANLASLIISSCRAAPLSVSGNFAVPASALTNAFATAYNNNYVTLDGTLTNAPGSAAYSITCRSGTNTVTGPNIAQVYLMLGWPIQANPNNGASHYYEVSTYISFP
jgi:type II secretory pathway pseudopilin PulG